MADSSGKSKAAQRAKKAAEARAEQARREKRRRILTIVGVVVAMVLIVGIAVTVSVMQQKKTEKALAASSKYGIRVGDDDAPREVTIYEDFLCPICGDLEKATSDDLARLADDGKVVINYRPVAILTQYGDYSVRAANAFKIVLDAAGAEVAKEYHDLLYSRQPEESGPYLNDDQLIDLAVDAGAKEADIRSGIEKQSQSKWVQEATSSAVKQGLQGTPYVLLDGNQYADGQDAEELGKNLIAELE